MKKLSSIGPGEYSTKTLYHWSPLPEPSSSAGSVQLTVHLSSPYLTCLSNCHKNQQQQREDGLWVSHARSARTCSGWGVGPAWAHTAWSRPRVLPFPQLVARSPGCNPRGLQEGEGTAVLAGREEVVVSRKSCMWGGGESANLQAIIFCSLLA